MEHGRLAETRGRLHPRVRCRQPEAQGQGRGRTHPPCQQPVCRVASSRQQGQDSPPPYQCQPHRHGGQHEQRIYDWQAGHDGCEQNQRAAGMDSVDDQARMEHQRDYQCLHRSPEVDGLVRLQHLRGKAEGQGLWCQGDARQYRQGLRLLREEGELYIQVLRVGPQSEPHSIETESDLGEAA